MEHILLGRSILHWRSTTGGRMDVATTTILLWTFTYSILAKIPDIVDAVIARTTTIAKFPFLIMYLFTSQELYF